MPVTLAVLRTSAREDIRLNPTCFCHYSIPQAGGILVNSDSGQELEHRGYRNARHDHVLDSPVPVRPRVDL